MKSEISPWSNEAVKQSVELKGRSYIESSFGLKHFNLELISDQGVNHICDTVCKMVDHG